MIQDVLQCCYTNTSTSKGSTVVSGWSIVASSEDIPPDALDGCTRFQKGNSTMRKAVVDEEGNDLNLLEVVGDGAYLYLMRSQFGLRDIRGRRNMFSHAYILPWSEEMLHDPNVFLTVSDDNFFADETEALVEHDSFQRDEPFELSEALELAGIETDDELTLFVDAVYEQMTNTSVFNPLYVQYDGSARQLRAFLYCLYTFLPLHLRRRLVSASAEGSNAKSTNIIFCRDASTHSFFFDSTKNTSNVISPARASAIRRLGFVDYAVRNRATIDVQRYFDDLERTATRLNVSSSSAAQIARTYKTAHTMLVNNDVSSYSDSELDLIIDETLRLASQGSDLLDGYVAAMLDEVVARSLEMSDDVERDLAYKLREPHSEVLDAAAKRYNLHRFGKLPTQNAASKLAIMGDAIFGEYVTSLAETAKGQEILDEYFVNYALGEATLTWELLNGVLADSSIVKERPRTRQALNDGAWRLYCEQIADVSCAKDAFDNYVDFMRRLVGERNARKCGWQARQEFWNHVDTSALDYDQLAVYEAFNDGSKRARSVIDMLHDCELLAPGREDVFLSRAFDILRTSALEGGRAEWNRTIDYLKGTIEAAYMGEDKHLVDWLDLVARASDADNKEWLEVLLDLRSAVTSNDRAALLVAMDQLGEVAQERRNGKQFVRDASDLLVGCFVVLDNLVESDYRANDDSVNGEDGERQQSDGPLPLDMWLKLGDLRWRDEVGGGPFHVLDRTVKPAILAVDPHTVVSESVLFKQPRFQKYAQFYVDARGDEFAAVRSWIREFDRERDAQKKKQDKEKRRGAHAAEDDQNSGAGITGFFGRIFKGPRSGRRG